MTEQEQIDAEVTIADKFAEKAFKKMLTEVDNADQDPIGATYSLFIYTIHYLAEAGFDANFLKNDVDIHVTLQLSDGTEGV